MSDRVFELLGKRMARSYQRFAQKEESRRSRSDRYLQSGTVLGVDSSVSINGNPVLVVKNAAGNAVRAASISSGDRTGQQVNIAKAPNSQYGMASGMPGVF